jgi:hypothetical protein
MAVPPVLRRLWARWKAVALVIGNVQARALLTLFYFVVTPPFALVLRLGRDPLGLRPPRRDGYWVERPPAEDSLAAARRQY